MRRRRLAAGRICQNPKCQEVFGQWDGGGLTGLCPSCRVAGRWGMVAAFLIALVVKLVIG